MTKTGGVDGGWDAGARSQTFAADGYVEFATPSITDGEKMFGLAITDSNQSYTSLDFAIWFNAATYAVYELGVLKFSGGASSASITDVFQVKRTGTTITYLKNGAVVYTSLTTTAAPLMADGSIRRLAAPAGRIGSIRLYDAGASVPMTWSNPVGVTMSQP